MRRELDGAIREGSSLQSEAKAGQAVCITSNDLGFDSLFKECGAIRCGTLAISSRIRSQDKHADVILSWGLVQSGNQ